MKMPSSPFMVNKYNIDESKFCNETSLASKNIDCEKEFCECNHVLQVPLNATVELILVDEGYRYDANHPFHLHGHGFRVVAMERIRPSGIDVQEVVIFYYSPLKKTMKYTITDSSLRRFW